MDIYVGNLPYEVTDTELQQLFEKHGTVSSTRVIMDRVTGRAKGFAFVEMPDQAQALKAIEAMNGADLKGRPMRVNESRPKPKDDRGGGAGGEKRW